jgi:hypothetical protein
MGHDSTTLHKKPRPHVIREEPVIKKRKLSNVTISSEPTTSESFDNESISNSQYIYTAEAMASLRDGPNFFGDFMNFLILLDPIICLVPRQ